MVASSKHIWLEVTVLYNYFRYYDSTLGRFITSDPIGLAGGSPLMYADPQGLAYSPQGEHGVSREDAMRLPEGQDSCGCFVKAFLGWDDAVIGGASATIRAATGPYATKFRTGAGGGGKSGKATSWFSEKVMEQNQKSGKKTRATRAARTAGRIASRASLVAGAGLLIYDASVFQSCIEECDDKECK